MFRYKINEILKNFLRPFKMEKKTFPSTSPTMKCVNRIDIIDTGHKSWVFSSRQFSYSLFSSLWYSKESESICAIRNENIALFFVQLFTRLTCYRIHRYDKVDWPCFSWLFVVGVADIFVPYVVSYYVIHFCSLKFHKTPINY